MARFRQAMIDDLQPAAAVYIRTLDDARHVSQRLSAAQRWCGERVWWEHLLRSSKGGFWVAEEGSTQVGMACALIRDAEWVLTHVYVVPDRQGRGIGRGLLERALRNARGIDRQATCADGTHFASTSLFMRHGLYPARDIFGMEGPVSAFERLRANADGLIAEPLGLHATSLFGHIDALDRQIRGTARSEDHRFWIDLGMHGLVFRRHGQIVGYGYCSPWGGIGPVAAHQESDLPAMLERCGQMLTEQGVTETSLLVPGINQTVLSLLLQHGFRQTSFGLYLATRPAGDWSHYLLFHSALP